MLVHIEKLQIGRVFIYETVAAVAENHINMGFGGGGGVGGGGGAQDRIGGYSHEEL